MSEHKLFVHEEGTGTSVIFLHGLGASSRFWNTVIPQLRPHRHVLCPDLLGFGRSPRPRIDYSVAAHVGALEQNVMSRCRGPVDIVGHSLGAILALELATKYVNRVRSITLLSFPAFATAEQAKTIVGQNFFGNMYLRHPIFSKLLCMSVCQLRCIWAPVLACLIRRIPSHIVKDSLLHSFRSISSTLKHCIIRHRTDSAVERLLQAGTRIHLVHGERDAVVPLECVEMFHKRYPSTLLHLVSNKDHLLPLTITSWCHELLQCGCNIQSATPQDCACTRCRTDSEQESKSKADCCVSTQCAS